MSTNTYNVLSPIKTGGRIVRPGGTVEFTAQQAHLLVRAGVLELVAVPNTPPPVSAGVDSDAQPGSSESNATAPGTGAGVAAAGPAVLPDRASDTSAAVGGKTARTAPSTGGETTPPAAPKTPPAKKAAPAKAAKAKSAADQDGAK